MCREDPATGEIRSRVGKEKEQKQGGSACWPGRGLCQPLFSISWAPLGATNREHSEHSKDIARQFLSLRVDPSFSFFRSLLSVSAPLSPSLSLSVSPVFYVFLCLSVSIFLTNCIPSPFFFSVVLLPSSFFLWFLYLCYRGLYVTSTRCGPYSAAVRYIQSLVTHAPCSWQRRSNRLSLGPVSGLDQP